MTDWRSCSVVRDRDGDLWTNCAGMWHVRRAGKNGSRVYRDGEFDALALVALDVQRIAYLPPEDQKQTVHIRVPGYVPPNPVRLGKVGKEFDDFPFSRALALTRGAR